MNKYGAAWRIGIVGTAFLCGVIVGGRFWLGLILLLVWTLAVLFALPLAVTKVQDVTFGRVVRLHPKE